MTPEETLKAQERKLENLEKAKSLILKVGLPAGESATSKAYTNDGAAPAPSVLDVGIWHEFGTSLVEQRSFIRGPINSNISTIEKVLAAQFARVSDDGLDAEKAIGLVGVVVTNICKGAFRTRGYGVWADITAATKARKGSSGVLIDTGLLRSSITWVVE